jgi:hypothetical protein
VSVVLFVCVCLYFVPKRVDFLHVNMSKLYDPNIPLVLSQELLGLFE